MDAWKQHIKAVLKDCMTNPVTKGSVEKYLDEKVNLIMSYIPEQEKIKVIESVVESVYGDMTTG